MYMYLYRNINMKIIFLIYIYTEIVYFVQCIYVCLVAFYTSSRAWVYAVDTATEHTVQTSYIGIQNVLLYVYIETMLRIHVGLQFM